VRDLRARCALPARVTNLSRPESPRRVPATVVELGVETLALRADLDLGRVPEVGPSIQLAIDLELPGGPELCAIAFLVDPGYRPGELLCRFVHIPLHERRRIEAWLGAQPPPRPAARARVG
jgi:hypothetical protein